MSYIKNLLIVCNLTLLAGCTCTAGLLQSNSNFEKYMQKHIGDNLREKTGPISIDNLLKFGKYSRELPEPTFQSLMKYDDENLIYKSNIQPFVISDGTECNISLIVDKQTLVINDYVYASKKSACGVRPFNCGPW